MKLHTMPKPKKGDDSEPSSPRDMDDDDLPTVIVNPADQLVLNNGSDQILPENPADLHPDTTPRNVGPVLLQQVDGQTLTLPADMRMDGHVIVGELVQVEGGMDNQYEIRLGTDTGPTDLLSMVDPPGENHMEELQPPPPQKQSVIVNNYSNNAASAPIIYDCVVSITYKLNIFVKIFVAPFLKTCFSKKGNIYFIFTVPN